MDFIQWVTERTPDPGWAFFWVYRTHRNIKSSGSSKIHWIWYLAFSKIWQNMDIYHPVDKIQWIKSSGFFCPSSGLGRSTGCLPNALLVVLLLTLCLIETYIRNKHTNNKSHLNCTTVGSSLCKNMQEDRWSSLLSYTLLESKLNYFPVPELMSQVSGLGSLSKLIAILVLI